jgi:hypothetical protein
MLQSDSHVTTACCSCLGTVHAHGGVKGWSVARQWVREAEGDGGRGTGSPAWHACVASGGGAGGKRMGCGRIEV